MTDFTTLLQGDARVRLAELPEESANCVVASPPYWGLRRYKGDQDLVWGGDPKCEHVFQIEAVDQEIRRGLGMAEFSKKYRGGGKKAGKVDRLKYHHGFCKCGAWKGALGNEPTPELYLEHLIELMRAVRRVLRKDGVVFLNIGDTYNAGRNGGHPGGKAQWKDDRYVEQSGVNAPGLKPRDEVLIPFRLALALQEDGWYVRKDIVWQKNNPMPESISGWHWARHRIKVEERGERHSKRNVETTRQVGNSWPDNSGGVFKQMAKWEDCPGCPKCSPNNGLVLRKGSWRPTSSHEYILMLTQSEHYWSDGEAVKELTSGTAHARGNGVNPKAKMPGKNSKVNIDRDVEHEDRAFKVRQNESYSASVVSLVSTRNVRSVWAFATENSKSEHFATFPQEMVKRCILASCPAFVCPKCGKPWARIMKFTNHENKREEAHVPNNVPTKTDSTGWALTKASTGEWKPTCRCGLAETVPGVALDPFVGTGTTCAVAQSLGRRSIGIEISEEYLKMARKRITAAAPPLFPVTEMELKDDGWSSAVAPCQVAQMELKE